jgi:murein DD-endopeptidase MepM/ murein hydrolase activator NlpD
VPALLNRFLLLALSSLLAIGGLTFCGRPLAAAPPRREVHLYPTSPRQGETLFAMVRPGPAARSVRCTWDGRAIPTTPDGDTFLATIGVRIEERPGAHSLKFKYIDENDTERMETRSITVRRTAWPVRHLTMSRSTERLYTFPGSRAEDAAVRAATRTFSDEVLWQGPFLVPTQGRRSTPFGVKRIRNRRSTYYHRGLDIAAETGTPVVAANAGRVVLATDFKKYGNTVVLDHGLGVTTLYIHMSALNVQAGDLVQRGQRIGAVGAEGVATGPHLHWSLYVHGNTVSPLFWTKLPEAVAVAPR